MNEAGQSGVETDCKENRVLLASEGRAISSAAIARAAKLAIESGSKVHVLSVARIWGSAFGLQHPGLFPTQREIGQQRDIVANAINELERWDVDATGEVVRSRNAAKTIAAKARNHAYLSIVMTANPIPRWLVLGLFWSHEPYRVRRFTKVPVHLVVDAPARPAHEIDQACC